MAHNSIGTQPLDLDAYDSLPRELKEVLRYAPIQYSANSIRENWYKAGRPPIKKYAAHLQWKFSKRFPGRIIDKDKP